LLELKRSLQVIGGSKYWTSDSVSVNFLLNGKLYGLVINIVSYEVALGMAIYLAWRRFKNFSFQVVKLPSKEEKHLPTA
jgi:NADH:ubiquinone oxidoreductase subunit K